VGRHAGAEEGMPIVCACVRLYSRRVQLAQACVELEQVCV